MKTKEFLSEIMRLAWQFVKRNGVTISEALKASWCNAKLKTKMSCGIVKFYYQKVDGTKREAYGTLNGRFIPAVAGTDNRKKMIPFKFILIQKDKNGAHSKNLIYNTKKTGEFILRIEINTIILHH